MAAAFARGSIVTRAGAAGSDALDGDRRAGAEDPLVPVKEGRDTARHIAGAQLTVIEGMGHDLAPGLVPILVEAIAAHCHGSGKR